MQVVIIHKISEIQLCVNSQNLNSVVVRDAFPLPKLDEALQAVHNCQWFLCYDLVQGYLQMLVAEADTHTTAFWAARLYEFTRMPFGLSNSGSSFFHLAEMCLGDQHFVILLLCLDNICISAANVDGMLDCIEVAFQRLRDFNLKITPKLPFFPAQHSILRVCSIHGWLLCQPWEGGKGAKLVCSI